MKDVIGNRIKRIEEILKKENVIGMVCMKDGNGYHWNGNTYSDEKALSAAVRLTAGDYNHIPLVIISKIGLSEKK